MCLFVDSQLRRAKSKELEIPEISKYKGLLRFIFTCCKFSFTYIIFIFGLFQFQFISLFYRNDFISHIHKFQLRWVRSRCVCVSVKKGCEGIFWDFSFFKRIFLISTFFFVTPTRHNKDDKDYFFSIYEYDPSHDLISSNSHLSHIFRHTTLVFHFYIYFLLNLSIYFFLISKS